MKPKSRNTTSPASCQEANFYLANLCQEASAVHVSPGFFSVPVADLQSDELNITQVF